MTEGYCAGGGGCGHPLIVYRPFQSVRYCNDVTNSTDSSFTANKLLLSGGFHLSSLHQARLQELHWYVIGHQCRGLSIGRLEQPRQYDPLWTVKQQGVVGPSIQRPSSASVAGIPVHKEWPETNKVKPVACQLLCCVMVVQIGADAQSIFS